MINGKKVIGVCLTRINDKTRANFMDKLRAAAFKRGYKLMIFNSTVDFFKNDACDEGSKSIYDIINYDVIDALMILSDNFYGKHVYKAIRDRAMAQNVPVLVMDSADKGCLSILKQYEEAYKSVIRHIVADHKFTDTVFVAGKKEEDEISDSRIALYKEVLEENGLEFSYDNVIYGEYWSEPTRKAIDELLQKRGKAPRAFICANDFMAIAACEKLEEMGYRVPEDVAVTGFDGVPDGEYFQPKLTTCTEDVDALCGLCLDVFDKAFESGMREGVFYQQYKAKIEHSCGCAEKYDSRHRDITYIFNMIQDMEGHEAHVYGWIDRLIEDVEINKLVQNLSEFIMTDSYMCMKADFIYNASEGKPVSGGVSSANNTYYIVPRFDDNSIEMMTKMDVSQIIPCPEEWAEDDTAYILTAINAADEVCGYYAMKTNDILNRAHTMNRISKAVNIAYNSLLNYIRQKFMMLSIENASLINPITKLPNLNGVTKWFEEFSADENNHKKSLCVSLYAMPKYKYIYENYGIKDVEEVLCFVAETFKLANPVDCYIAHISENEFVIVNYFNDGKDIGKVINNATSAFFTNIEHYNNSRGKPYYVEINCGCTVVQPGWNGTLATYTKIAGIELYANLIKNGTGAVIKGEAPKQDFYDAYNILIEKNLFLYHFQPIVNAKNGEIYAYEALMRTEGSIGMNPLQILDTARAYNRLYDIERATILNVMRRFSQEFDTFGGHMIFINSIPGYFLNDEDAEFISKKYSDIIDYFVFEITEQDSISDDELNAIKALGVKSNTQIAIDDYGTGHSNIVNLLRYEPQIIKIDRFLVSNIHKDINKQMFVRSTIDFARLNNIKVLAEGVETSDELRTVIDFGVDYIQGFYTGRPALMPIPQIADDVKQEILSANPLFSNV